MFKKALILSLSFLTVMGFFYSTSSVEAAIAYDYEYVTQSAYPSSLAPNATTDVWLDIKNTGTATWYTEMAAWSGSSSNINVVRLGAGSQYGNNNQKRDYNSEFHNSSNWLSNNRPAAINCTGGAVGCIGVAPGEIGRFGFSIKAPSTPGVYKAYFTPVADGITWMKDIGIYWQITVTSDNSQSGNSQQSGGAAISVTSLSITPSTTFSIRSGDISYFTAAATYSNGTVQDVTDIVAWEVIYNTGTGVVDADGRFIAGGIGTCKVRASFAGKVVESGTILITSL